MRYLLLLISALLLLGGNAFAYDVLIVQSSRNGAYDDIISGFRDSCAADARVIVLSDYAEVDVYRVVREERPRLVVTLGDEALGAVKNVRQTPVLALMNLQLQAPANPRGNVTGVDLFVAPERYFPIFAALKSRTVGVVHDPSKTGRYVKRALVAAQQAGVNLVVREARNSREAVSRLAELKDKVDALWLVPDTTAVMKETIPAYFEFSLRQRVPVVSFTAAHLRLGAAAVVEIQRSMLGRQAGEMAVRLLRGALPADVPVTAPRSAVVKSNAVILKNLGLPVTLLER